MNFADSPWLASALQSGAMLALFVLVFLIAKAVKELATDFDIRAQLTGHDNPAVAIALAGYYLGVMIVFIGAYLGPSEGLLNDLLVVGLYSLLGILLLNVARWSNDHFIMHTFSVRKELLEDHNAGTAAVVFASYVASGLVVAGAIHGEGGGIITALVFFALGQAALVIFTWVYDWIAPYSLHEEIERDNVAAGVGFAGALIGIGLIVMDAVSGDFIGWVQNLTVFVVEFAVVVVFLVLVRLFFDRVVLSGADLNREIAQDRNLGAGFLELTISIGFSAVLVAII
ncbi:MAG: DUF350 domain-containing protein [Nitrococcus sp.]|nr:DUF350 domain-containing protein [Nitrococcus sp.]